MYPIIPAALSFDAHYTPYSQTHNDIYFLPVQGVAESGYVFIEANKLKERFQQAIRFTIAELGLGTGLNLALTIRAWKQYAPNVARLTYIAIEKHPIPLALLTEIHQRLGIEQETTLWRASYPLPLYGVYATSMEEAGVEIIYMWMEAADACAQIHNESVDAWFLDGFAPAKNPDMWEVDICQHVARALKKKGSFSTFTAAGEVRRGLLNAGLHCERIKGYGKKRHMVIGSKTSSSLVSIK
jgi:tRNA 5-methylaminomethyl-2-thiouridine biosynthesis bifunctional protein